MTPALFLITILITMNNSFGIDTLQRTIAKGEHRT